MNNEYSNENNTGRKDISKPGKGGQQSRKLSLREQVNMISNGAYVPSMSDRAAVSREDNFDPNSKLANLKSDSAQSQANSTESGNTGIDKDNVAMSENPFTIRRSGVKSYSPVKKASDIVKAKGKGKQTKKRTVTKKRMGAGKIIRRILICLLTLVLFLAATAYAFALTVAHGPSETARNQLVIKAQEHSATKWLPEFILGKEVVDGIIAEDREEKSEAEDVSAETEAAETTEAAEEAGINEG